MQIDAVDIYVYKYDQHYRLSGTEHVPGLIAGTDYFFEPNWRQAYSRRVETCLIRVAADSGLVGWGEAQAPILPETPGSILRQLFGPFLIGQNPLERARIADELYHMNQVRGHGSDLARLVRLDATDRDQRVAALRERFRDQVFQLARLVAAGGETELVVALDPQLGPAQLGGERRHGLERRGERRVAAAGEAGEVHGSPPGWGCPQDTPGWAGPAAVAPPRGETS